MSSLAEKLPFNEDSAVAFAPPSRGTYYPAVKTVSTGKLAKGIARGDRGAMRDFYDDYAGYLTAVCSRHNRYDNTDDELLVESIIYEIKAANMKFQYYLGLCKDRGIVCGMPLS